MVSVNLTRILGLGITIAAVLEIVTEGRIGPLGLLVGIVIAIIITNQTRKLKRPAEPGPSGDHWRSERDVAPPNAHDPYGVLGVARGCSDEELSKAYHALVRQWHPDQLEGMAQELRQHATARLAEINQAFEEIHRSRAGGR